MQRLFTFVAALLAAFTFALPAQTQTLEKPKIAIGVGGKSLFYYLPLTIALQKGYFKDEGLDVEVQDFPGGARECRQCNRGAVRGQSGPAGSAQALVPIPPASRDRIRSTRAGAAAGPEKSFRSFARAANARP